MTNDPEKQREYDRRWREKNPEHARELGLEANRRWYAKHQNCPKRKAAKAASGAVYYRKNRAARLAKDRERYLANPEPRRAYAREWYQKNRAKGLADKVRRAYDLSPDDKQTLVDQQGGRCAICREPGKLFVDHDHAAVKHVGRRGSVRGLLCHTCNMIVHSRATPAVLQAAIAYLADPPAPKALVAAGQLGLWNATGG